ncbi:rho-related GTP-binding protein RhoA-D-like [Gigantopelta aegis]|uniref:rho-related GTP-binding protein RhoA-D-like n=1 Tax=Gigantopelta aegis TaxID=1735272 RepID=UPI001B88D42E|nr:rho-related GTP-binding protein RhoA-D-like [Gigantopelta aegis]
MTLDRYKLVVVGDGGSGKTCLLTVFCNGTFPETYVPTIFENSISSITVDNKQVELELWDTAGQEEYDRLRPLSYTHSHVVIICFSFDCPDSLENAAERWKPEIAHHLEKVPIVLVGNKKDLINSRTVRADLAKYGQRPITSEDGRRMATRLGVSAYLECSSKTQNGVQTVFETATRIAMSYAVKKPAKGCTLL